jgi:hypothetical protein
MRVALCFALCFALVALASADAENGKRPPPPPLEPVFNSGWLSTQTNESQLEALRNAVVAEELAAIVSILSGPKADEVIKAYFDQKPPEEDKKKYNLDRPRFTKKDTGKKNLKKDNKSQEDKAELVQTAVAVRDLLILTPIVETQLLLIKEPRYHDYISPNRGETPLMRAVVRDCSDAKNASIVKALLAMGADVEVRSPAGYSVIMVAASVANPEAIQILIEAGADVNAKDGNGATPIDYASNSHLDPKTRKPIPEKQKRKAKAEKILNQAGAKSGFESMELDWQLPEGPEFVISICCYAIIILGLLRVFYTNMVRSKYRNLAKAIYVKHLPEKLETLEALLDFYSGRYPEMMKDVESKYLKPVYKAQLNALYKKEAPEMIEKLDTILDHYAGAYAILVKMIKDKYSVQLSDDPLGESKKES